MSIELSKASRSLAVAIMAAGKGTRMKNPEVAKVMNEIGGKPMIAYVVDLTLKLQAERTVVIVGWQKQSVIDLLTQGYPDIEFVEQTEQLGTGHAIMQTMTALKEFEGDLLVLSGDVPLLTEKTARALVGYHRSTEAAATILTAELKDPAGYGRVVRQQDGSVQKIVEHKDASKKELAMREINAGIYVFDKQKLFTSLVHLEPNNAQGEYYLTDVFEFFRKNEWRISAVKVLDPVEVMGINDIEQLESARATMAARTSS